MSNLTHLLIEMANSLLHNVSGELLQLLLHNNPWQKNYNFSNLHQLSFIFASSVHWRDDKNPLHRTYPWQAHAFRGATAVTDHIPFFPIEAAMEMDCTCSRPVIHLFAKWDSIQSIVIWGNLIATGGNCWLLHFENSAHISHQNGCQHQEAPEVHASTWIGCMNTQGKSAQVSDLVPHLLCTRFGNGQVSTFGPRCNHQNFITSILLYLHSGGGLWLTSWVWIRKVITRSFRSSLPWYYFPVNAIEVGKPEIRRHERKLLLHECHVQ